MSTELEKGVEKSPGELVAFGPFRLFPKERRLERDGVLVGIGGRALDLLVALLERPGKVVSKSDLVSSIWPGITVVEAVLRVHVCNLRKALGDGEGGARYITSVAGRGYCFVAPVERRRIEATRQGSSIETTRQGSSSEETGFPRSEKGVQGAAAALKVGHGLPTRLERMTGRDGTVRRLLTQLMESRFVTIVGAAGIGKTTVAVAVGHALLPDFADEVRLIELASVMDPGRVAATVASVLGVPVQTDDALPSLEAFLQDKRLLLILDNCEHVVEAAAALAEHLFAHAPRVHLLTTSREALRVEGEQVHRLLPLYMPADHKGMSAEVVQTFPAVQVFLERAAASGWCGDLTDDDVPLLAGICERLDGVALALELAASFMGECGLQGTAAILDDRLRLLLQPGRRTAPPRQQTLCALIAWSYDRLPDRERVVLRRLSVFVGAFSIEAAKAVVFDAGAAARDSLPEVTNELANKSLLSSALDDPSGIAYRMLETTRAYALERLAESGELDRVSQRHASFFAERLSHAASQREPGPSCTQGSDLANVRAALDWCFSSPTGHAAGARLVAAAAQMLLDRGLVSECHDRCRKALAVMEATDAGTLIELKLQEAFAISAMFWRGVCDDVRAALIRALHVARALGGGDHEARLLEHLNVFLVRSGDFGAALDVAEQGLAAARRAGPRETVRAEWMLGRTHHVCGNQALAEEHCQAGLRLADSFGEGPSVFLGNNHAVVTLARTLWLRGRSDSAVTLVREIVTQTTAPNRPVEKCLVLIFCENVHIWRGDWSEADRVLDMLAEHIERYSLKSYRGIAMALRGELLVKRGRAQDGCRLLETAVANMNATRIASLSTTVAGARAEGLAATGWLEDGLCVIEAGIQEANRRGGTFDLPELLRIKGVVLAGCSLANPSEVEETLSSAIELARRQGALAWELRATVTLTRERLRRRGPAADLRDLSAIYARFTEGLQTLDLQAARILLDRHASR
jgi:predicted ATPase/DNA-binding winged helix-turn-helix (wHTH) protein